MAFARPVYAEAAGAAGVTRFEKIVPALNSILQDHSSLVIKPTIPVEIHAGMDTGTGAAESPETLWEFFDEGHPPLPCAAPRSPVNEAST